MISCYPNSILLLQSGPSNSLVMTFSLKQPFQTFSEFRAQLYQVVEPPMTQVSRGRPAKNRKRVGDHLSGTPTVGGETASRAPPQCSTSHEVSHYAQTCQQSHVWFLSLYLYISIIYSPRAFYQTFCPVDILLNSIRERSILSNNRFINYIWKNIKQVVVICENKR